MNLFARACDSIASTPGKLDKVGLLAEYFRSLDDADLESAARFFTGNPFAQREQKSLSLGGNTVVAAARNVWGFSDEELAASYREFGDLGSALAALVRPSVRLGLFEETLRPASLKIFFDQIAAASGPRASTARRTLCERIFTACRTPEEAKYVVKIVTGDLRIGLREGLVVEAVALAFERTADEVRRAVMASGDIGSVAVAARHNKLDGIAVVYGSPLGFMLASPMLYGSAYRELHGSRWIAENKFDGIRVQAHKADDRVQLFSRTLNDVSHSYPEVVEALRRVPGKFILDGELVAHRDGVVLPFRYLQARLQRKTVSQDLLADIPVSYVAFDILAQDDTLLLDHAWLERRKRLEQSIAPGNPIDIASYVAIPVQGATGALHAAFERSRAAGHEGLMLKREDAPYHPGRRGKWWLKLKRELATLDVAVVGVEWGHGKRAKVLSDYTFAVRDRDGGLTTIGKAYSGLTDREIADLTDWFLAHKAPGALPGNRRAIAVQPSVVLEVAFDVIQKSSLHGSGFALRFPRIVRIRDDKPASEIDGIERVEEIYAAMLEREGVSR